MTVIPDDGPNPINGLRQAPEWAGTNVFLACREVAEDVPSLYAEERRIIAASAALRRRTFASGRRCARDALAEAGLPPAMLLRADDGAVIWPEGIIGSISHTQEWAVAAVAVRELCRAQSLGVDLERIQTLGSGVLELVATDEERQALSAAGGSDWQATALFSLKESLYKCLRPLCGRFIDFDEVQISDIAGGRPRLCFRSDELRQRFPVSAVNLRMAVTPAHVFTLAWLEQE